MQKSKTFLTTLLSTLLIFTPIYPHTAQASATYTLPANLGMEKMTNVAKRRGLTHPAIQLAIEGLVGAIDWIMLEGTVIKYHPKPVPVPEGSSYNPNDLVYPVYDTKLKITVVYTNPTNACKKHLIQTYGDPEKYVTGYMFSHIGLLSCKFRDPSWHHESSIGWFPTQFKPTEYTLPLEAVLQEVINNAEKGNQASIDYLQSIADEIAKEEGKPTTEPKPPAPTQLDWGLSFKPTKPVNPPATTTPPKPTDPPKPVDPITSQHGSNNNPDSKILEDWVNTTERDANGKKPDRCAWLAQNKHKYSAGAVKATEKAWGCRHSRVSKDKKGKR